MRVIAGKPWYRQRKPRATTCSDFDCEETKDGIIQNKTRRTYLTEYGIGVSRSLATSTAKFDWTYSDFEKDGEKAPTRFGKPASDKPV